MTTPALAQNVRGKGRHYKNPKNGDLVPSVTNIIGMMDKPALPRWSAKLVAERAALMKRSLPQMDDADIVDTLKAVPWQRSNRAADRGTDIHAYLEARLNDWEPEELSADAEPYKAAADDWMLHADIEVVATELTAFHPLYAGTMDFVARVNGVLTLGDFKTSKAIYDEAALQLSALWGCYTDQHGDPVPWRDADGDVTEMPVLEVVRIGHNGWESKQVEDPMGSLRAFFGLLEAWNWKHSKAWMDES
ncbi:MAG TPA: hypothetical protein VIG24_19555 [Acidimicrobiia bacterium]